MDSTELFQFRFVNRIEERKKCNSFLHDSKNNVLWIRGDRGIGKTKFVDCILANHDKFESCIIDIKINSNSVDIITDLILKLQEFCDKDFMSIVTQTYKKFYDKTYKVFKDITPIIFPKISSIATAILDTGSYVVTQTETQKESINIINDYLAIILKSKSIFLCIDNLSRCDLRTATVLFQIIKNFTREDNFRACIITTSEDLQSDMKDKIYQFLPVFDIELHKFDEYDYFYQILEPQFDMSSFANEDIKYICHKCEGSPKRLATLISKLLERQGISYVNKKKAIIDKKIMFQILQAEHIKFRDEDFNSCQKWILFSYLCLEGNISIKTLSNLTHFISGRFPLYNIFDDKRFTEELLHLIERRVLILKSNEVISHAHDADYIELLDIFNESQMKGMFSQWTYEFLKETPCLEHREHLMCLNARNAVIAKWEKMNFHYGKKLLKAKQYYDAQKVFVHLQNQYQKLHPMQLLALGITSYETGNYDLAIKQFQTFTPECLKYSKAKFYYNFYCGKSHNNKGDVKSGANYLELALKEVVEGSSLYVQTLNLLHMYYLELPDKREDAKKIFEFIQENHRYTCPEIWGNTMRGCQNFIKGQKALDLLDEAVSVLSDEVEKAYIKNTRGFILIKNNQISEAKLCFKEASDVIKTLKHHEFSYAANNLAVCYMMENDYTTAYHILLTALLWNRTNYSSLAVQIHLMVCACYLSLETETEHYVQTLEKYIDHNTIVDPTIKKKIFMNLAIVNHKRKNSIASEAYFKRAREYVVGTESQIRFEILTNPTSPISILATKFQRFSDFEPWFLIYAHD